MHIRYYLTIDQGNTTAKVALWTAEADSICIDSRHMHATGASLSEFVAGHTVVTAIYSSVAGNDFAVIEYLRTICPNVMVMSVATPLPLKIDYRTPETLGIDRLAAAVGAASLPMAAGRELLIADLGTAITYDRVTADGRYIGGNIAPGIFMRLQALNHYTARLPLVEPADGPLMLWGDDTASALRAGALNGVLAEFDYYRRRLPHDGLTVITGGAADLITPHLHFGHISVPDLVSLGLLRIIQYNTPDNSSSQS